MLIDKTQAQNVNTTQETNARRDGINRVYAPIADNHSSLLYIDSMSIESRLETAGLRVISKMYEGYRMNFITVGGAA